MRPRQVTFRRSAKNAGSMAAAFDATRKIDCQI